MIKKVIRKELGSGAASPLNSNLIVIDVVDVLKCPSADEKGILVESDIVLKAGKKASSFYVTSDTIKINADTTGDIDQEGFEVKMEAFMPGDNLVSRQFSKEVLQGSFIVLLENCKSKSYDMLGDCCNPIRISTSVEKDKDKTLTKVMMKRPLNTDTPIRIYKGSISMSEPITTSSGELVFNQLSGNQLIIDSSVNGNLSISSNDFDHGENITLVGASPTGAATLNKGEDILLKDGLAWQSFKDASITLKVFSDGSTKKLIELSRD